MITITSIPAATAWLRQEIGRGRLSFVVRLTPSGPFRDSRKPYVKRPMSVTQLAAYISSRYEFEDAAGKPIDLPRVAISHVVNDPESAPNVRVRG